MSQHGMTCREFVDFLMEYLDDELQGSARTVFEEHLRLCPPCEAYLHNYAETVRLVSDMSSCEEDPEELPEAPEALVQAVLRARRAAADDEGTRGGDDGEAPRNPAR